ncbi:MAG TPA: hypothetical protein VMD31_15250 [Opitutaceae bacterium]|nr:hypothetical protein [Opitutaceae bacterium]
MPVGGFVNAIPMPVFLVIHAVAFLIGATFARKAFAAGAAEFGWGFALYALAELSYVTYHLDWTVVLFAHTVAEVLDLLAFILVFTGLAKRVLATARR